MPARLTPTKLSTNSAPFRPPYRHRGFTLVEIIVAVAILAILLGWALPAYRDYTIRSKVAEGIQLASEAELLIADSFLRTGDFTAIAASYDFPADGSKYVADITIDPNNGTITLTTRDTSAAVDPIVNISPIVTFTGNLEWNCTLVAGEPRHVPLSCRALAADGGGGGGASSGSSGSSSGSSSGGGNGGNCNQTGVGASGGAAGNGNAGGNCFGQQKNRPPRP